MVDSSSPNSDDEKNGDGDIAAEHSTNSRMPKQRVTTKGNNAPERVDTFEELRDRYRIHSHLMANLKRNGYEHPTGIQSAGCPILLEVRSPIV
jgi:ATP-dependent RNA helicase DDX52/ROK1